MKKLIISSIALLIGLMSLAQESTFYQLSAKTIQGEDYSFEQLKGKKVMIVNTATKCSLSPQFNALQELHEQYADQGFVVLAFPSNDFANREPGDHAEIIASCEKRFGISFTLMEKISVKGELMHPVYQWLTQQKLNGSTDSEVKWNFQKYLIDEKGQLIMSVEPMKKPDGEEILAWIKS